MALCCSWLYNEAPKHLFLFSWLALNSWLFYKTFVLYYKGPQYYYLHQMLGLGLCLSRASASVLNLNCTLILLPMCRIVHATLRGSKKILKRSTRRLLDKTKSFHALCGMAICVFSAVHVGAHIHNAVNFSARFNSDFIDLNVARYKYEDPRKMIFTSVPGLTGVLMVLILFLMSTASTASIRASNYDIFFCTHNLFFIFYVLLLIHASGGVLKYQSNLEEHPPGCFYVNTSMKDYVPLTDIDGGARPGTDSEVPPVREEVLISNKSGMTCSKRPAFQPHFPETWLWISGPLCLYCAERLYRYMRSTKPVTITSVIHHPCNVIEIRMLKDNFQARPGQYIILQCPKVSILESHPFTLTMCPTETKATFAIHMKVVGDWTERFCDLLASDFTRRAENLPKFQQKQISRDEWNRYKLQRLYFVWICRDIQAFLWFADLLCLLHKKLWQENRPDYLNIQLYLTQADGIQKIIGEKYQALNSRLFIGRPCWKPLFAEIAKSNRQKAVGVFCCGPRGLSRDLHNLSNNPNAYGTTFEYNKESFC